MDPNLKENIRNVALLLVKTLECPICLEVLEDPFTTKCHHRFCRSCIEKALSGKYKIPCPLCNAVVTKRSLSKSENFAQIVQKVRKLSAAIKEDTGLDVTPPRGPRTTSTQSPEGHSLEIFNLLHPSPFKTATQHLGEHARRNVAPKRKRRATSTSSAGSTAKPSKAKRLVQNQQCGPSRTSMQNSAEISAEPSVSMLLAGSAEHNIVEGNALPGAPHQGDKLCEQAEEEVRLCDLVSCPTTVSSISTNHLLVRPASSTRDVAEVTVEEECCEDPMPCAPPPMGENKKDYSRRSIAAPMDAISASEKVSIWLHDVEESTPKSGNEVTAHSDVLEHEGPLHNKSRSRFFTVRPLGKRGSPGGKKKFLDVSDSDPYKFIPSQKAAQGKGRRRRKASGMKRKTASLKTGLRNNKLGCTSKIIEEAELEFLKGGPENITRKRIVVDPSELEVELFVTPALAVEQTEEANDDYISAKKKRSTLSLRKYRKEKDVLDRQKAQKETEMLQKKIAEAETFELSISKTPPRKRRGLSERDAGLALKDVSNLKAKPSQRTLSQFVISPRRKPHTVANVEVQSLISEKSPGKHHETVTCMVQKGPSPVPGTAVDDSPREQALPNVDTSSTKHIIRDEDEEVQECLPLPHSGNVQTVQQCNNSDINVADENVVVTEGENMEVEVLKETPGHRLEDLANAFKKPSRKTFDVNADTEDMQHLAAAALNTLEFVNDLCNYDQQSAEQTTDAQYRHSIKSHVASANAITAEKCHSKHNQGGDRNSALAGTCRNNLTSTETDTTCTPSTADKVDKGTAAGQPQRHSTACCPNCSITLIIAYTDGEVTVSSTSSTDVPQKTLLVDRGMCTEKPGTRVIICKEAVTQTEEWDTRTSTPQINEPHANARSSAIADALEPQNAAVEVRFTKEMPHTTQFQRMQSDSYEKVSPNKPDTESVPQECTNYSVAATMPKNLDVLTTDTCEHGKLEPLTGKNDLQPKMTIAYESNMPEENYSTPKESEADVHIQESEILCKDTEDQADSVRPVSKIHFSPHLTPVVEETQEQTFSTTAASTHCVVEVYNKDGWEMTGVDKHTSSDLLNKVSHQDAPAQSVQEIEENDISHCNASTASDLPDIGNYQNEEPANSKEVTMDGCSVTQLPLKSIDCPQSPCQILKSSSGCRDSQTVPAKEDGSSATPADEEPMNLNNKVTDWNDVTVDISASNSRDALHQDVPVVHTLPSAALQIVEKTPEKLTHDAGHNSGDSSPDWSPPIVVSKARTPLTRSLFEGGRQENDSEAASEMRVQETTKIMRNNDSEETCRGVARISNSKEIRESARDVVELTDSESNSSLLMDPITESEANELLQCALLHDEDSPDEAAMNFARNAVAPLKNSTSQDDWMKVDKPRQDRSGRKRSQKVRGQDLPSSKCQAEPMTSTGMRTRKVLRKSQPAATEGFATEGETEGHPHTTYSSLSCLEDRTLKEKLLEQDIEEMKKQMQMLENELEQAVAMEPGDVADIPSDDDQEEGNDEEGQKSSTNDKAKKARVSGGTVLEEDFLESDDELLFDAVPPTPPRKGISRKQHSFSKDKNW